MSQRAESFSNIWAGVLLVALTAFAYAPVAHYGFINYDDPQYVTGNPNVNTGLTWQGLKWAFNVGYQSNWHPLTWLSHMLDVQLFGANAGAHHLTNVVLHIANTLLLFWFLLKVTRAPAHSTLIAALFAIHPLHVESVAWVSERKDVLSTFFGMLTLCAYAIYACSPRRSTYFAILGLFALSLTAKPMLVTLPFVLLLLDYWPLRRFTLRETSKVPQLVGEKIPMLALAVISSLLTYLAQQRGGAVVGVDAIPVATRAANAFVAYFDYLRRMFWPARLSILYPAVLTPRNWWWLAALGVVGISILSILSAERRPYIPVGWFWYLGTLVPVIGLIQVGRQATADRYAYVPLIGISLIVVFGISEATASLPGRKYLFVIGAGILIAACIWRTRMQLEYWGSSRELWAHTLGITSENEVAQLNLALALQDEGKVDEAIVHFTEAARIEPHNPAAQYSFASILVKNHRSLDEAAAHLAQALRDRPDFPEAHDALGIDYLTQGKLETAAGEFGEAIRLKPDYADAHYNLGLVLVALGRREDAISEFKSSLRYDPSHAEAHDALGAALFESGRFNEAVAEFTETERLNPGLGGVRENLETARRAANTQR